MCTGCAKQIPARGMVLRAGRNVYHVNCFVCTTCTRLLKTGDKYCIIDDKLFCEQDARATKQQEKLRVKNDLNIYIFKTKPQPTLLSNCQYK